MLEHATLCGISCMRYCEGLDLQYRLWVGLLSDSSFGLELDVLYKRDRDKHVCASSYFS